MSRSRYFLGFCCGVLGCTSAVPAQDSGIVPSSWKIKIKQSPPKFAPAPLVCSPPTAPCPPAPGVMPTAPAAPGTPAVPTTPATPTDPGANPLSPLAPDAAAAPVPSNLTAALTGAEAGGTSARATALPQVFGDLLGGGFIAGPLPVVVNPNGQIAGALPIVVLPNGQRQLVSGVGRTAPSDELILGRAAANRDPNATVVGVLPGPGQVFDPTLAAFVARVPQVVRGAFKIGENDTPRPTTRAYFTYNFYDQISKGIGGPDVPRIMLHQEVFGYEHAFSDGLFSLGVRLPYNQLVSNRFLNETSLGDLTLTSKVILRESSRTGSLLSAGLLVTAPTGQLPFPSSLTGRNVRGALLQPYVGYIALSDSGRAFAQGFSGIVVPTDDQDVTFLTNTVNLGYKLVEFQTGRLSAIVPVAEFHLNTPLDHRYSRRSSDDLLETVGFVDSLTILGGTHFVFRNGAGLGVAVGAPVTGPRPFSLQATIQANFRF